MRLHTNVESADGNTHEQQQDRAGGHKPKFLANDRQDEVCVGFGEIAFLSLVERATHPCQELRVSETSV